MWKDNWLSGRALKDVFTNGEVSSEKLRVLLSPEGWKEENIRQRFPNHIANMILAIPIGNQDRAYWQGSSDGNFSTKATWEQVRSKRPTSEIYRLLWHQAIPIKITMIAWRTIEDLIPTDLKMRRMGVIAPSRCQCCDQEESIEHIFLTSEKAMEVWKHYNRDFGINIQFQSVVSMIKSWYYSHDWIQRGHIRTWIPQIILWALWKGRNESKHKGKKMTTQGIIQTIDHKILSILHTKLLKTCHFRGENIFCKKYSCKKKESRLERVITFRWEKPEESWMKLNVDGCSKQGSGCSAAGGLLRNGKGEIIFSFCTNLGVSTAYLAELHAARLGLQICMQRGVQSVWLEMDSLILVKQLNGGFNGNSLTFAIFMEIKRILSSIVWRCTHIWREANAPADLLAAAGLGVACQATILDPSVGAPFPGIVAMDAAGLGYVRRVKRI